MNLTKSLYELFTEDVFIVSRIGEHNGLPAVYSVFPVPEGGGRPYIIIEGAAIDMPDDTKVSLGRDVTTDIRIYEDRPYSSATIDELAYYIRDLLHRSPLEVSGYEWVLTDVNGPIVADTDTALGRWITVRVRLQNI